MLKSLNEHNTERWKQNEKLQRSFEPHPNGIECPVCKLELWDSNPTVTLASCPPQKNIHCPGCGYQGYRIA